VDWQLTIVVGVALTFLIAVAFPADKDRERLGLYV
jgi:hypothetical protein